MEPGGTRTLILKFVQHADGTFTLPNDAGNIGQDALSQWKAKSPKATDPTLDLADSHTND